MFTLSLITLLSLIDCRPVTQIGSVVFLSTKPAAKAAADAMLCCGHGELLFLMLDFLLTRAAESSALARVCCDVLKRCIRFGAPPLQQSAS